MNNRITSIITGIVITQLLISSITYITNISAEKEKKDEVVPIKLISANKLTKQKQPNKTKNIKINKKKNLSHKKISHNYKKLKTEKEIPEQIKHIAPQYPPLALENKVEGELLLELIIDELGKVISTKIIKCDQPGYGFEEESIRALSHAQFKPSIRRGQVTAVKIHYPISFVLIETNKKRN